jgi:F0F1-type ATP synthase alpha subunit
MEVGLVLTMIDGVGRVVGLDDAAVGELIVLTTIKAVTLNLEFSITGLTVLGNDMEVEQGDLAERTYVELLIGVGFHLIGRIVDAAGNFIDG